MPETRNPKIHMSIRLSAEARRWLTELAQAQGRSQSNVVEAALEKYYEERIRMMDENENDYLEITDPAAYAAAEVADDTADEAGRQQAAEARDQQAARDQLERAEAERKRIRRNAAQRARRAAREE